MYIKQAGHIEKASKLNEGEIEFVVSTTAWDAHGERINVDGIQLKDYKKNPVVLWAHDGFNLPIAKATKVWKEGNKLMARAKFYMKDEFPRKVYDYIVDGFLNAVSIGGQVDEWGNDGLTISKMTMKEFSVVPVPANQEALVANKSLEKEDRTELNGLAKAYARKMITEQDNDTVLHNIKMLKELVASLEEIAMSKPNEKSADQTHRRLVLRQTQAVDDQAEKTIKSIKVTMKRGNTNE